MDDYEGDFEDLEMVDGADTFLDYISQDGLTASIDVFDDIPDDETCPMLEMLLHDEYGATYQVNNFEGFGDTVWLCNVAHLFFQGEHPRVIYFQIDDSQD